MSPIAFSPMLFIDGQEKPELGKSLQSLLIEEAFSGTLWGEVRLLNWGMKGNQPGYLYFDSDLLAIGKELTIEFRNSSQRSQGFKGPITALEAYYGEGSPPEILVIAEDCLHDLRVTRRTRVFENMSAAEGIRRIAEEHGLISRVNLSGPTREVLTQVNESDLAFMRELVHGVNGELRVEGKTIYVTETIDPGGNTLELTYGLTLKSFRGRAGDGMNPDDEQRNRAANKIWILDPPREQMLHRLSFRKEEDLIVEEANRPETSGDFLRGRGVAEGNPRIRVGCWVTLNGLGSLFDGRYSVVHTRHGFDLQNGFQTEFEVERPGGNPAQFS